MRLSKPILCVDFDGVIHSYTSGWKGAAMIPDAPVPGALQWLRKASEWWDVQIYSSRTSQAGGIPTKMASGKCIRQNCGFMDGARRRMRLSRLWAPSSQIRKRTKN